MGSRRARPHSRRWASRGPDEVPPLPGPPRDRHGTRARARVALAPDLPAARLRRAPPRAGTHDGGRATQKRPARRSWRDTRRSRRSSSADSCAARWCRPTTRSRRRRSAPASPSSRMARTVASAVPGHVSDARVAYGTRPRSAVRESPRHAEPDRMSALDVKDRNGNPMPGYGWIFPVGDGSITSASGMLSTFRDFKSVNTPHLLDSYAHQIAERWEIDPGHPECPPTSGRIRGWLRRAEGRSDISGDRRCRRKRQHVQRGGHRLRVRDGRRPPTVLHDALVSGDASALQRYRRGWRKSTASTSVARLFARVIGGPPDARATRAGSLAPVDGVGAADHGEPAATRRDRAR